MDETEFWELVDGTREAAEGDPEEQADLLVDRLLLLDPELVLDFARHFEARYNRAYTWDLWGAAWVLLDGASDDAFDFFRCWLIGQGREVYEGAVHDPDSLAELIDDFDDEIDGDGEELGYAADEAYEQLTGAVAPTWGFRPHPPSRSGLRSTWRTRRSSPSVSRSCERGSGRTEPGYWRGCPLSDRPDPSEVTVARIPYPERSAEAVDALPTPLNAFRMLSHAPDLTGPAIDLGMAVLGSSLPVRLRELVVMAVATHTDCAYGIVQHRPIALHAGLTVDQLASVVELRPEDGEFDELESALLTASEELVSQHSLTDGTLGTLRKHLNDRQLVELITTVGYYTMLAGLLNGLGVDIDPVGEKYLGLGRSVTETS